MSKGYGCRIVEDKTIEQKNHKPVTPDWCPLKAGDVIVTKK